MSEKDVRQSEINRRSKTTPTDGKQTYKGPERRFGKERRIWIDRMQEIHEKTKK